MAVHIADDAMVMFPNAAATKGRQAIQSVFEADFRENTAKIAHSPLKTEVAGDWAYECGNFKITVTAKSGKPMEACMLLGHSLILNA